MSVFHIPTPLSQRAHDKGLRSADHLCSIIHYNNFNGSILILIFFILVLLFYYEVIIHCIYMI